MFVDARDCLRLVRITYIDTLYTGLSIHIVQPKISVHHGLLQIKWAEMKISLTNIATLIHYSSKISRQNPINSANFFTQITFAFHVI